MDTSAGVGRGRGGDVAIGVRDRSATNILNIAIAEEMRIARAKQQQLQQEAERARDQAIMALEIARAKMNHVLQHAQLQAEPNDKIRRQRL